MKGLSAEKVEMEIEAQAETGMALTEKDLAKVGEYNALVRLIRADDNSARTGPKNRRRREAKEKLFASLPKEAYELLIDLKLRRIK